MVVAPYDASRTPAAIVVPVAIQSATSGFGMIMPIDVDVLAEHTVIAASIAENIGLALVGEEPALLADGSSVIAHRYVATVWVGQRSIWTTILGYGDASYLGRDILDRFRVTLDGVKQQLSVSPDED